ncbi:MAG: AMP-binding protein [Polyangiaceae bacterium]|nr:AMP-binding protein [Polyangiaceae bacterium]
MQNGSRSHDNAGKDPRANIAGVVPTATNAPLATGAPSGPPLVPSKLLAGARLVVVGGTGFLGKVWAGLLLHRFPEIGHLYLLVRPKADQTAEERFWSQIAPSPCFDPVREAHPGAAFEAFMRDKITPVAGDVVHDRLGIDPELVERLSGSITAVVNVSGVVDFNPPLDEALEVNAFGVNNLVSLAKALGAPVMHTSTCYVAGYRSGLIEEVEPGKVPFPRASGEKLLGENQPVRLLERSHWDPQREIDECLDLVKMARHRSNDAFRQSAFLDEAKKNLASRGEPCRGAALEDELAKVKRKFVEAQLIAAGEERARFWGWSNIYTYTKSIGEQVLAASGVPYAIVRPAVVESSCEYPVSGWNEGINTSAPFIYMALKGTVRFPGDPKVHLDIIPVDMVASGMIASLCELIDGTHRPVYQYGVTDTNPCSMERYLELIGLYKRKKVFDGTSTKVFELASQHFESMGVSKKDYRAWGPHQNAAAMRGVGKALDKLAVGPLAALFKPAAKALEGVAKMEDRQGDIMDLFVPFTAESDWIFSNANTRAAFARMPEEERAKFIWAPEAIDWRLWMYDVHLPGLEKWVLPQIDEKMTRELKALRAYDHLLDVLDEVAERHGHALALQEVTDDGLTRITYKSWRDASYFVAEALQAAGVEAGDRVVLSGKNSPAWAIAYFGILRAGAVAVPVDPALEGPQLLNIVRASSAEVALWDASVDDKGGPHVRAALPNLNVLSLVEVTSPTDGEARLSRARTPSARPSGEDIASIIYTSGTTGEPKGVMLMHKNFTSLLAALAPLFPLTPRDHVLSVLPLHHTFEFTCGLLLPLMLGARIVYLRELTSDGLREGLAMGKITAMAGVPALWQLLERRILSEVKEKGPFAMRAFDAALELNRLIGKQTGLNAGRVFFGSVHDALGGRMRHMISGGAARPKDTAKLFAGLGMPLSEGYGLTEAAPVLTVAKASMKASLGHVGHAVPGVQIKIANADAEGVGEVWARGPNVMKGYEGNPDATAQVLDADGWLHTGDLGKLDKRGRLTIVGRSKEVIVGPSGENVYPDDVETLLATIDGIKELSIVGIPDGQGGERVGCLAVPAAGADDEPPSVRSSRRDKAHKALREAFERLPRVARPTIVHFIDADLPRTATRKVKRSEVRDVLKKLADASASAEASEGGTATQIRHVIASITNKTVSELTSRSTLRGDLGVDSLLAVELGSALESAAGVTLDPKELAKCETVADIEDFVRRTAHAKSIEVVTDEAPAEDDRIIVPEPVAEATKRALTRVQMGFYERLMRPRIFGRAHIPHNRNTIVASNHASHLDMGFVKFALGTYGEDMVSLAAQDYFFEGNKWRRAYFENFTNLAPFDRKGGLRQALRIANEHLERGRTILIFPEGTRSPDGALQEFKPAIGYLALTSHVDILPVYLGGTYEAMRKGSRLPTRRDIYARIGLPLAVADLKRLTEGMKFSAACRKVAEIAEQAVRALKDGTVLDIRQLDRDSDVKVQAQAQAPERPLVKLFRELEGRFRADRVDKPLTFYFTLGAEADEKWTLRVDPEKCSAAQGKPDSGVADCVLKTSPEIFFRIVREAYVPTPMEFMTGAVKSNDVALLQTFQKVFDLS